MNSFYTREEIAGLNLKAVGENVLISRKASIYCPEEIEIKSNVRIDDFCMLSGTIAIGSFVHISAYTALYGQKGIVLEDYSGLSPRCTVLSATDDFSGDHLMGPMVRHEYKKVSGGRVWIKKYAQVGAGCIIFPDLTIEEGVAVGAMSLVNRSLPAWGIFAGIPARYLKPRSNKLLGYCE